MMRNKQVIGTDTVDGGVATGWRESDRLAALRGYGILDTPPDPVFDDFTRIAAHVCAAPIAVVNLIDETRQWFASELGLGVRETPRDISICAHALLQSDLMVVPDLTRDARFAENPLIVGDPRLRFYGGALLTTPQGLPLGTMCVLDHTPRPQGLSPAQRFTLQALARQVMAQLELRRTLFEKTLLIREVHHRVKNSLQTVQSLLLLQARATTDAAASGQLRESAARVRAFGAMHDNLYQVGDGLEVDLLPFLDRLMADQQASAALPEPRSVRLHGEGVLWPSADAAPIAIMVLELVTNAMKHGAGTVDVQLGGAAGSVAIAVTDEGRGLPPDFVPGAAPGLGMRVILGLARARGGTLAVDRTAGTTRFVLHLPLPLRPPDPPSAHA